MSARPIVTRPLAVFLVAVGVVVGVCALPRLLGADWQASVQRLADGDLEGFERKHLWQQVQEAGDAAPAADRMRVLAGAMAAVCRGDEAAYGRLTARLGPGSVPIGVDDGPALETAALGEPMLVLYLGGWLAEARGDRAAAGLAYRQVAAGAGAWGLPFLASLAQQALGRIG